jgi:hypothetical protein
MPRLLSQKQYAQRKRVSPQYVNKLVREGKITLEAGGKIDPKKADAMLEVFRRPGRVKGKRLGVKATKAAKKTTTTRRTSAAAEAKPRRVHVAPAEKPTSATRSLAAARAEREDWQAKLARLDYEERSGKLLPADEVVKAQEQKNVNFKTQLFRTLNVLVPILGRCRDDHERKEVLFTGARELLEALSRDPLGLRTAEVTEVEAGVQTSAEVPPADAAHSNEENLHAEASEMGRHAPLETDPQRNDETGSELPGAEQDGESAAAAAAGLAAGGGA